MSLFDESNDHPIQLVIEHGFYKAETILLVCHGGVIFIHATKVSVKYVKEALNQLDPTIECHQHYDGVTKFV